MNVIKAMTVITGIIFILGILFGKFIIPTEQIIPVSERIKSCEEKGGKYNLFWGSLANKYYERCEIIDDQIKDF